RADGPRRALRLRSADVSDLRAVERGDGLAAGAHLPDERSPRRPDGDDAGVRPPLRCVPRLHGLRDRVPLRRTVRAAHRGDTRSNRAPALPFVRGSPVSPADLRVVSVSGPYAARAGPAGASPG